MALKLSQIKALRKTDLSMLIRISNLLVPRVLKGYLPTLTSKQRKAFDQVMPVGGEKQFYVHLVETPTPPILIHLAQPPNMCTMPKKLVDEKRVKGIRLTMDDLQLAANSQTTGSKLKLVWRLRKQWLTLLGIGQLFMPLLVLGPADLQDMGKKMKKHLKPVFDLMPN